MRTYVTAVVIVMAAVIVLMWLIRGPIVARKVVIFAIGFFCGMLAMFIAVHVYK